MVFSYIPDVADDEDDDDDLGMLFDVVGRVVGSVDVRDSIVLLLMSCLCC